MPAAGRNPLPPRIQPGAVLPSQVQAGQVGRAQVSSPLVPTSAPAVGRAKPPSVVLLQPPPALPRQQTGDRQANALQEGQRASSAQSRSNPQANSNTIQNLALVSGGGGNLVRHGLGRAFRSARLEGMSANVTWWIQRPSGIAQDAQAIVVFVSANVVADLVVY